MATAYNSEELQLFRLQWKNELRKYAFDGEQSRSQSDREADAKCPNRRGNIRIREEKYLGKSYDCSEHDERLLACNSKDQFDFLNCVRENSGTSGRLSIHGPKSLSSNPNQNDTILFSLPQPGGQRSVADSKRPNLHAVISECGKRSLVDQLIEDIDEVSSIPFFDVSLPREVGIQIFSHLEFEDLCACCQVSKSWKLLAEDELIWYHVGCKLGYIQEKDSAVIDRTNWKAFVQHNLLEERNLKRNWKERICKLSSLEFERGGSLCAVSIDRNSICSGYSNGAVVIWETDSYKENISSYSYRQLMTSNDTQTEHKPQVTSTAIYRTLCVAGFKNGDAYAWHTSLSLFPLCHCQCEGSVKTVCVATSDLPAFAAVSDHELRVHMSDSNGHWTCTESRNYENRIGHAMFIPASGGISSTEHIAIATQDTATVLAPGRGLLFTLDCVIGGKLSCMDSTSHQLALGVGSYGYGTLGNKVRLYNLETAKMISILGGHYREITCLDLASCPPHRLVTGSYDCRVRVFDLRNEKMVLAFNLGHKRVVTTVQMDDWKVVSGAEDGTLMVWDQRMTSPLWMTHARHPVRLCNFQGSRMITANIPLNKSVREDLWYADDLILHRRHRGVIRLFDFSAQNLTEGIPEICSSNYDDTAGYNYNINLSVPYDKIEGT